ncbi:MAG: GTP 3',8-cyclase MoaA [Deltaproteobacteria bacterium]|nr:GTP 3',8-cyclase MoaA [Deltaproteobacteria bacterium]
MPKLLDTYNRHISYLRISVTDRCNLRCIYCMPKEGLSPIGHDDILRYEEILRVARSAAQKGISKIRVTGGEPLVRRGIIDFIGELNRIPGIADLSITTNGVLLEACAEPLYRAGMRRINISLDTLNPEKYKKITRGGDINSVLVGISKARQAGFAPIKINVVAMRNVNDDEAVEFARLTLDRPVHIRFIEFMPVAGQTLWEEAQFISSEELQERIRAIGTLIPLDADQKAGPAKMFQLEGAQGKLGFITALSNHFCATCNRLRLTADGKLRACLFSDDETDVKPLLRGSCSDDELSRVIDQVIRSKPQRHDIHEATFKKCSRTMSAIGG